MIDSFDVRQSVWQVDVWISVTQFTLRHFRMSLYSGQPTDRHCLYKKRLKAANVAAKSANEKLRKQSAGNCMVSWQCRNFHVPFLPEGTFLAVYIFALNLMMIVIGRTIDRYSTVSVRSPFGPDPVASNIIGWAGSSWVVLSSTIQ